MQNVLSVSIVAALAIAGFSGSVAAAADEEAPKANSETVRLSNNDAHKAAFEELRNSLTWNGTKTEQISNLWRLSSAAFKMRDYTKAESYGRQIIELDPDSNWIHDPLSVYLGKQGKYDEAIVEAQKAIRLDPAAITHANLVLASLEWLTGKKDEALKRVDSIALPQDKPGQRSYYNALLSFYATVDDEEKIADAITKASALDEDGTFMDFLARDAVFNPYREKDWFTKLLVKTLLESKTLLKSKPEPKEHFAKLQHWFYLSIMPTPEERAEAATSHP